MTGDLTSQLENELRLDEGWRSLPYLDKYGNRTIGVGHNLEVSPLPPGYVPPLTRAQILMLLQRDVDSSAAKLDRNIPWWRKLSPVRQRVLLNMTFNLGWGDGHTGLSGFHTFLHLVETGDFDMAATDMLTTLWARQVGARATRLAAMMRAGWGISP